MTLLSRMQGMEGKCSVDAIRVEKVDVGDSAEVEDGAEVYPAPCLPPTETRCRPRLCPSTLFEPPLPPYGVFQYVRYPAVLIEFLLTLLQLARSGVVCASGVLGESFLSTW